MTLNRNDIKRNHDFSLALFAKNYLLNQVDCIFSLDANNSSDHRKVSELFATYNKILGDKTTPIFKKSMNESEECINSSRLNGAAVYEDKLKNLEKNKPQSFLIIPMTSTNHLFCALVRKNDEGFSATLVNASKGGRRGDDRGNRVGYEEYIFNESNLPNLMKTISKTYMNHSSFLNLTNDQIYKLYEQQSDKKYPLNIVSRDQKDGNCYVKEPEKAIKFALDTSDFSQKRLAAFRNDKNLAFTPKWPIETEEVHKRYIQQLINENPELKAALMKRFEKYLEYKHYALQNSSAKMPLNGRTLEKPNSIEIQDNNANTKGFVTKTTSRDSTFKDKDNRIVGYGKTQGNRTDYFDDTNRPFGYSIKEDVGEKYFDISNKLIGFGRFFYGMRKHTGEISAEVKGKHPIDRMIELSKSFDVSKFMQKNNPQKRINVYGKRIIITY